MVSQFKSFTVEDKDIYIDVRAFEELGEAISSPGLN